MAGVTDTVFRRFIRNLGGCGLIMTEFTSADGILRSKDRKAKLYLHFYEDEHPISAQLFGSDPKVMAEAARMVEGLGFDLVDLNLGCPAKKVVKCNGGSGLLQGLARDREDFRGGARCGHDSVHGEVPRRLERRQDRLRRTGEDGGRLRTVRGRAACPHPRAGLQRPGALGVDCGGQRRGEDSGHRQWRYPHAGRRLRHGGADRMRCGDDRPDGAVESVDLPADRAVLQHGHVGAGALARPAEQARLIPAGEANSGELSLASPDEGVRGYVDRTADRAYDEPSEADRYQMIRTYFEMLIEEEMPGAEGKMKQFASWFTHGVAGRSGIAQGDLRIEEPGGNPG